MIFKYMKGWTAFFAVLSLALMGLEVYMDLMQPTLMANIVTNGVGNMDLEYVYSIGKQMILFALLGAIGGGGCSFTSAVAGTKMGEAMRNAMYSKIQNLSFREVDRFKTSTLITRLTNDVTQIQTMVTMGLKMLVRAPFTCIGGIYMAYRLSKELSVILLISMPVLLIIVTIIAALTVPLFKVMQTKLDGVNTVMRENLLGARVVKAFTMEKKQNARFTDANNDLMAITLRALNRMVVIGPLVMLIMNFSIISVFWYGGYLAQSNVALTGNIMAFVNYFTQILFSMLMVMMIMLNVSRAKASLDRIKEVMRTENDLPEAADAQPMTGYSVRFEDVEFGYDDGGSVLKELNFTIEEGEKVGIIGPTGCGKSTLLNLIPRLFDTTSGTVYVGGQDVRKLRIADLRKNIGVVLQENIIFSGDIESNICFGGELSESEKATALKIAQADEIVAAKENGIKSEVEQRGKNLSGGQKQRISIARTLALQPQILILDDSSSALDVGTSAKLQNAIRENMGNCTLIEVAQRITSVMSLDKVIVLTQEGTISAIGTHEELLQSNDLYRSIAVSQLGEEVLL